MRLVNGDLCERYKKKRIEQLLLALIHRVRFVHIATAAVLLYYLEERLQVWRALDLPDEFGQRRIFVCEQSARRRVKLRMAQICSLREFYSPASGIVNNAATALSAERFSSSCFSYSCFTEFAFTFIVHVLFSGSTNRSNPV